jgi:hypothetical protein
MSAIRTETNWSLLGLRWLARAGSLLSTLLLLLFLFGEEFHPAKITLKEWVGLIFFPGGVVVGMIVAWWKEGIGAGITLASLLAFYVVLGFLFGDSLGVWFVVFAAPGFLFLLYWILSRSKFGSGNQLSHE